MTEHNDKGANQSQLSRARNLWNGFNAAAGALATGATSGGVWLAAHDNAGGGLGVFCLALAAVAGGAVALRSGMQKEWPEIADDVEKMGFGNRYYWGTALAGSLVSALLVAGNINHNDADVSASTAPAAIVQPKAPQPARP